MQRRASIPARINIIGEHTDYLGGLALPFASKQRLTLTATSAESIQGDETIIALWQAAGGWPAHLAVESSIPIGAGLSSSAALCLAVVLCSQGDIELMQACKEAQRIEHEVLGTPCGLLDQIAMMHAVEGHATFINFSTMAVFPFLIPEDWCFKLVDSKVRRTLASTPFGASKEKPALSQHADGENQRVLEALKADPYGLGRLLNASHASLKSIGVSHPKVDRLVDELQSTPGVLGARMMGGGFGGMILVLVEHEGVLPETEVVEASKGGFLEELFE